MDGPGDITDEFDDDALRESIEQAERQGQWRENAAGFVDPKLETLKKQLAEAERTHASYAQRRLRELAQRAAAEPAAPAAVVTTAQPADPFAGDWRAAVAPTAPAPSAPNPGSLPEPKYVASARSVHPMRTTLRPLLSGFGVFLPTTWPCAWWSPRRWPASPGSGSTPTGSAPPASAPACTCWRSSSPRRPGTSAP